MKHKHGYPLAKKGLSLLLAVCLTLGAFPVYAQMPTSSEASIVCEEVLTADDSQETDPFDSEVTSGESSAPATDESTSDKSTPDEAVPDKSTPAESAPDKSTEQPAEAVITVTEEKNQEKSEEEPVEEADPIDPYADDGSGRKGEAEAVAELPNEDISLLALENDDAVTALSDDVDNGVTVTYSADATTAFKASSLSAGQVWVDKSVTKTADTETSFQETLSVYANEYTSTSEYSTGNYVLVVDTTRSLYNADHSGSLVKAVTSATNSMIDEICKNPLSNVAVVGFSADKRERTLNKNANATTVLLGMGNWSAAGKTPLVCDTSSSNECEWYIGASDAAKNSKVSTTGKRYISYGTFTQAGIAHAASILDAQSDKADTAGFMILLTDGVPTYGTTKWAAAYDTSNAAWQSTTSDSIGDGGKASPKAAAYTLMTMQYWKNYLTKQYESFSMLAAHFSNDGHDSDEEEMAKWDCGSTNNITYIAGTSGTQNNAGYIGTIISSGYPKNRLAATYTGSKKADLKTAAGYLSDLMTSANLTKLGLTSASTFNAPCIAQFTNLSSYSTAANKATALNHVFSNLRSMMHKDITTQGGLKDGTTVTFTTQTGAFMTVSGSPVLYYNNKAYNGTKSGSTYTYSVSGYTAKVTVSTANNQSTVTVTIPADLVNKNGLDNGSYPVQCRFKVDLFSSDYNTVYKTVGGNLTTYTNQYQTSKTSVTYTTSADNPYYAATGSVNANKSSNPTGTLAYVSSLTKAKAGKQSTALLGNNGKLSLSFKWGKIELLVWEQNQADETKVLSKVGYHVEDSSGKTVVVDGKELKFTSTSSDITLECVPAGAYTVVVDSVPAGYVHPKNTTITVKNQLATQHYDFYVPTILIDVWAIDRVTGEKVSGVRANLCDTAGKVVFQDVSLEYIKEYAPAGSYIIKVTSVPSRYMMPDDTPITVKEQRKEQDYVIPLEHLGSITVKKTDEKGKPLKNASFTLADSTGKVIMTKTTDTSGQAVFMDSAKLVPDTYTLTEVKTASGKSLLSKAVSVTIPLVLTDEEAKAQSMDNSKGFYHPTEKRWYFYDLTFEITNSKNFKMPMTGGESTMLNYTLLFGLFSLSAAVCYLILIYKRG